jgi:hypothetical protein
VIVPGANWGATAAERAMALPCDGLADDPAVTCHRAISVEAPVAVTHRRLCQLRAAPYSYDLLDNFGRRSPVELTPGLGELEIGQRFMRIFRLVSFDETSITLRAERTFVTYAVLPEGAQGSRSRILVRVLFVPRTRIGGALAHLLVVGDLVMMRKQLLTLRDLAQRDAAKVNSPTGGGSRGAARGPLRPTA